MATPGMAAGPRTIRLWSARTPKAAAAPSRTRWAPEYVFPIDITGDPSGDFPGLLLYGLLGGSLLPLTDLIQVLQLLNALFGLLG